DDFGSRRGLVAQRPPANAALEFVDQLGWKSVRKERERFFEMDADHFPMAGCGVFAGGRQRGFAVGCEGRWGWLESGERLDVRQAQAAQMGQLQSTAAGDVAQCVAAFIAVSFRVGHFADAYTVEDDPDDAAERHTSSVTRGKPQDCSWDAITPPH